MRRNDARRSSEGVGDNFQDTARGRTSHDGLPRRATSPRREETNRNRDTRQDGAGSSNPAASDPAVAHLESLKQQVNQRIEERTIAIGLILGIHLSYHSRTDYQQNQIIGSNFNLVEPLHNQIKFLDQMKSVHLLQQELGEPLTLQRNILSLNMENLAQISSGELTYQTRKQHLELLRKKASTMINDHGQQQETMQILKHAKDLLSDMATHLQHNYIDDEGRYIYQRGHEIDAMISNVERR